MTSMSSYGESRVQSEYEKGEDILDVAGGANKFLVIQITFQVILQNDTTITYVIKGLVSVTMSHVLWM